MTRALPWRALFVLTSAALAFGLWQAATRLLPEADPARWTLGAGSVPMEVSQLGGALRPRPGVLDLSFYRVASPRIPAFVDGTVELVARVPTDGQLFVRLGADTVTGPHKPVVGEGRPGTAPTAGAALAGPPPSGATPGGAPGRPPVGGARPGGHERGVGLLIDRSASGGLRGRGLTCADAPAPVGERFALRVVARAGTLDVSIDGIPATRCQGQWSPGAVVFGSGVRRVQIESVALTPAGGAPFVEPFGGVTQSPLLGAFLTLLGGLGGFVWSRRVSVRAVLAASPLLTLPLLGLLDLRGALDTLRLLDLPEAWGPLLFAGVPASVALVAVTAVSARSWWIAALRGLAPVGIVGLSSLAGGASAWLGLTVLAGLGAPWAVLVWVNTHPVARRVVVSYALSAALLVGAEGGLRLTSLDETWARTEGWKRASQEFAELLEIRRYRAYPDEGFPARPPEPDPSRRRIVALGGSSTGGAFQMDDLDQFWPRRLEEGLAGTNWQVVNQGVGGWNTLHVRLYVESQIERLDPDILVLYVGHNDILSPAPVPYRDLYAQWRAPSAALTQVSDVLNSFRLYGGLKHALFALRGAGDGVAVPVEDARVNVTAIVAAATAHGARVLLVNEGLNPDPVPMRPYGAMLASVAESTGNAYLDAAEALRAEGLRADGELFLDDCHLSVEGHVRLAGWVRGVLEGEGWVR
ncbi:MAG: SGNH/GDSL hydrolase family protein [Myxococcota bacterium]